MTEPHDKPDTLLRVYAIKPGKWDEFLDVWRRIVVLRRKHGFEVLFALVDRDANIFTWAVSHDEDIDQVAERYYADPDRVALEYVADFVDDWKVTKVSREPVPA